MPQNRLEPKLLTCLREGIPRAQLARDVGAGLIVGVITVPLAIAFVVPDLAAALDRARAHVTAGRGDAASETAE